MKKLLLVLAVFYSLNTIHAQCGAPQSSIDLQGNNIRARILNGGDLFTDFNSGQFIPNENPDPAIKSASTIFAAGLWMGGVDAAGNLKVAAVHYRNPLGTDYSAGPLGLDGVTDAVNCSNWDRMFRVTGMEIAAFKAALPMSEAQAILQFPGIMGWPANGNNTFSTVWGFDLPSDPPMEILAPFSDVNHDGRYQPLEGDYPAVQLLQKAPFVPAEIIWCVFNDQRGGTSHNVSGGKSFQMEIQLTAWAFNCLQEPVLNNTVFTSHRLINRSNELVDSFYVGFWVDFDLGCYIDDHIGCSRSRNTMFAYNKDAVDGNIGSSCNGAPTFEDHPPVQSVTFLKSADFSENDYALNNFISYGSIGNPATNGPVGAVEYYRNLTGNWRDGTPLTFGQTGYGGTIATDLLFPGDPSDPNAWSMCTSGQSPSNRVALGTQEVGHLFPGQILELNTAWAVHENVPSPCSLGNTLNEVDIIRAHHENNYAGVCSPVTVAPFIPSDKVKLFPNPGSDYAILQYGSLQVMEIRVLDQNGKLMQTLQNLPVAQAMLQTSALANGIYTLQLITAQGYMTKKLAIMH